MIKKKINKIWDEIAEIFNAGRLCSYSSLLDNEDFLIKFLKGKKMIGVFVLGIALSMFIEETPKI